MLSRDQYAGAVAHFLEEYGTYVLLGADRLATHPEVREVAEELRAEWREQLPPDGALLRAAASLARAAVDAHWQQLVEEAYADYERVERARAASASDRPADGSAPAL
jgi:hypothetical protein